MQDERPRVALNAQLMRLNEGYRSAGIARYIFQLVRELAAAAADLDLALYTTEPLAPDLLPDLIVHGTRVPAHKPLARILWEQTLFAWALARNNYALHHSLAYVLPFLNRTPSIVTIYDLTFFLYPQYLQPLQRLYLQVGTRAAAHRVRRLVTISESSKRDLIRMFHIPAPRVDVVTPGVGIDFFVHHTASQIAAFRARRGLPEKFVLSIGTREPRKNIPTLLRAFALAKRAKGLPHRLVLAGGRGWMDEEIPHTIEETGLSADVILPGFVPHDELPLWYRAADAFVYPSQYEGFGMPPLEALASGAPVITSNVSSLPEAVGDAGLLVDPRSVEQVADALMRVLTDEALAQDLRARGPLHARHFTWARAAQLTAQSYRRALGISDSLPALNPVLS